MINREILGIYLGEERLHYACVVKGAGRFSGRRPGEGRKAVDSIETSGPSALKELLAGISPARGRRILLALPRDLFFARDLTFPAMPPEEALEAVQSALPLHCHLPLDEIYYDIVVSRFRKGKLNLLVLYAPRGEIDRYRTIFRDTGHLDSLKGIFPVSVGIGAWLAMNGYSLPAGIVSSGAEEFEFAVYGRKGMLFSMTGPADAGGAGLRMVTAGAVAKFPEVENRIYHLSGEGGQNLPAPSGDRFGKLPGIGENLAVAVISPALAGWQPVSVDPAPPKVKTVKPLRIIIPLALAAALACYGFTVRLERNISVQEKKVAALASEVKGLAKKLEPLEAHRKALKTADKFRKDVNEFMSERPSLFGQINAIAKLVPEGTWFSSLNFKNRVITLKGQSGDALKVLEDLRKSDLFGQVKLRGTVSRRPTGEERFSLTIKLKTVAPGGPEGARP